MKKLAALALTTALGLFSATQANAFIVQVWDPAPVSITSLAQADTVMAAGAPTTVTSASQIDYDDLQDSTRGLFSVNNPFPGGATSTFVVRVTGQFFLGAASTVSVNSDDGMRFLIDGVLAGSSDSVHDNQTVSKANVAAGLHSIEIVFFENSGGASLEFFAQTGTQPVALVQSVPEPASLALLGMGLVGVAASRRRKSQQA